MTRIWLLPSRPDPESAAIEKLLGAVGEVTATTWDDPRVQGVLSAVDGRVYAIEREDWPEWATSAPLDVRRIDHHSPGDPGYGISAEGFIHASSLGQVISALGQVTDYPDEWERVAVSRHPHWNGALEFEDGRWIVRTTQRNGDPGEEYGECTGAVVPLDLVLTAAADHCLSHAYAGECPGVDPDALMTWRAESRAAFQGRPVEDVIADVERAREALRRAPLLELDRVPVIDWDYDENPYTRMAGVSARDMRRARLVTTVLVAPFTGSATVDASGIGDARDIVFDGSPEGAWDEGAHHTFVTALIPELPEAAARDGICFVSEVADRDGRVKVVCQAGDDEQIRGFLGTWDEATETWRGGWAEREGLVDVYGDPERGFAGGYEP